MTAISWAIRLLVFSVLVLFVVQNTHPVRLNLLPDQAWEAPLVIVLLLFFVAGALLGALSLLGVVLRQRRQLGKLQRSQAVLEETPAPPPAL